MPAHGPDLLSRHATGRTRGPGPARAGHGRPPCPLPRSRDRARTSWRWSAKSRGRNGDARRRDAATCRHRRCAGPCRGWRGQGRDRPSPPAIYGWWRHSHDRHGHNPWCRTRHRARHRGAPPCPRAIPARSGERAVLDPHAPFVAKEHDAVAGRELACPPLGLHRHVAAKVVRRTPSASAAIR